MNVIRRNVECLDREDGVMVLQVHQSSYVAVVLSDIALMLSAVTSLPVVNTLHNYLNSHQHCLPTCMRMSSSRRNWMTLTRASLTTVMTLSMSLI